MCPDRAFTDLRRHAVGICGEARQGTAGQQRGTRQPGVTW